MTAEIVNINTNKIPPKTFRVRHKGLYGTVTYDPATKRWDWIVNMHVIVSQRGSESDKDKATNMVKKILDTAATAGNNVTTPD